MIGRRNVLKMLGLGTAAAPLAAKEALEGDALKLTRIGMGYDAPPIAGAGPAGTLSGGPQEVSQTYSKMASWLSKTGYVPPHVEAYVRDASKAVHRLDPDIAIKRSWSLAAKIHEQRKRNYATQIEGVKNPRGTFEAGQEAFEKLVGFRWMLW